jgi:hypothetical protein
MGCLLEAGPGVIVRVKGPREPVLPSRMTSPSMPYINNIFPRDYILMKLTRKV